MIETLPGDLQGPLVLAALKQVEGDLVIDPQRVVIMHGQFLEARMVQQALERFWSFGTTHSTQHGGPAQLRGEVIGIGLEHGFELIQGRFALSGLRGHQGCVCRLRIAIRWPVFLAEFEGPEHRA